MKDPIDYKTLRSKIEFVRQHGNYSSPARLRKMMMQNLSFQPPKTIADNAIVFGCYSLYSNHTRLLKTYIRLMEYLGVDYTFLENEYCCGSSLVQSSKSSERNQAIDAARSFLQLNSQQAIEQNIKTIAYFCSSCARIANSLLHDDTIKHKYLLDLLLDHVIPSQLQHREATVGYFEGCHATINAFFSDAHIPWSRYREILDSIDGLTVIDLSSNVCCRQRSDRIIETLLEKNLSVIVCSCNNCVRFLERKAGEKIQVKHMVEIISEALVGI